MYCTSSLLPSLPAASAIHSPDEVWHCVRAVHSLDELWHHVRAMHSLDELWHHVRAMHSPDEVFHMALSELCTALMN